VSPLRAVIAARGEQAAVLQAPSIGFGGKDSTPVFFGSVERRQALGWAHARRVAEAVTTADGPSRSFSQPCSATRQMKNTQLCGCPGGGPGRTRAAGLPL
jgi:hypothetical protein